MLKTRFWIGLLAAALLITGCATGPAEQAPAAVPSPGSAEPATGGGDAPGVGVPAPSPGPVSLLSDRDQKRLAAQGLSEEALIASLVERTDLLPIKGVVGGTSQFVPNEQWVITPTWVLAHWNDGHIDGYVVARYQIVDGEISWVAVDSGPAYLQDPTETAEKLVADRAKAVLGAFAEKDGDALVGFVHTGKGVRFSPYGYVGPSDVTLASDFFPRAFENPLKMHWGYFDGSGEPIELTIAEYVERFVTPIDFGAAEIQVGYHQVLGTGNTLNNLFEAYPNGIFVEYHYPGSEEYSGLDWRSLRLVFERGLDGEWALVGVISDQWTI